MQKVLFILQARLGSTRLPQKMLKPLLGKPLLSHLFERLEQVQRNHKLILATTKKVEDTRLAKYAKGLGHTVFRGSSDNVLDRYYEAAKTYQGEVIVRITGDCPLIQPTLLEELLDKFLKSNLDYLSNVHPRSYPKGFDLEIFSFRALEKAQFNAESTYEKEHVTPFFYQNPSLFKLDNQSYKDDLSHLNVSVDTEEDFYWVEKLFQTYYAKNPLFGLKELIEFAKYEPDFTHRMVSKGSSFQNPIRVEK